MERREREEEKKVDFERREKEMGGIMEIWGRLMKGDERYVKRVVKDVEL